MFNCFLSLIKQTHAKTAIKSVHILLEIVSDFTAKIFFETKLQVTRLLLSLIIYGMSKKLLVVLKLSNIYIITKLDIWYTLYTVHVYNVIITHELKLQKINSFTLEFCYTRTDVDKL